MLLPLNCSLTTQVYNPWSPSSVGSIRRLLFRRKVYFAEGDMAEPSPLCQVMETGVEAVKPQSNLAGWPKTTTTSLGAEVNTAMEQ